MSQVDDATQRRDERALWQSRLKSTETLSNRALQREKDGDLNASYSLCIQAARAYLWLIRNSPDETTTKNLKAISAKLLTRAEKIKQRKKDVYAAPVSRLDEFEQSAVSDNSSVIRGRVFRPWSPQLPLELLDGQLFSDPGGHFSLSKEQEERLASFKRISELSDSPVLLSSDADPKHIWQSCVTDCTVISSLISCLQHSKRFTSPLCTSLLYPRSASGHPQYNPHGKYVARLALNGTWRAVGTYFRIFIRRYLIPYLAPEIDDYLPLGRDGSLLCAHMRPNNDYWAALLEKAARKLPLAPVAFVLAKKPSYSDSAADLYTFTGWIPETIFLRHPHFRSEQTWNRLHLAFKKGRCLLSLGSGASPITIAEHQELASKHAFAVIALEQDARNCRTVELVDPWVGADANHTPEARTSIKLSWDMVCSSFHSLYCNWDHGAFDVVEAFHLNIAKDEPLHLSLQMGPSASIEQDEVWILLSKHTETKIEEEYLSLQVREDFSAGLTSSHPVDVATDFTNSPHILVKFRPERTQALLNISVSKVGPRSDVPFTLTVLSPCPIHLSDASVQLPYLQLMKGRFDEKSAGGNPTHASWIHNPQYAIAVDSVKPMQLQATIQASKSLPLNLKLIRQAGQADSRVMQFETCAIVAESGAYTYRTATLTVKDLPKGRYLLVPSTFEPGDTTDYLIRLKTSSPIANPTLLPSEGSGKFVRLLKGSLPAPRSDRMLGGHRYSDNPRYCIRPRQVCWLSVRLRQTSSGQTPLNASLFADTPAADGSVRPLGNTGPYASYVAGVSSSPMKVRPSSQDYILVVSGASVGEGHDAPAVDYELSVFSDHPVDISPMLE